MAKCLLSCQQVLFGLRVSQYFSETRGVDPVLKVGGRGTNLYIHCIYIYVFFYYLCMIYIYYIYIYMGQSKQIYN